MSDIQDSENETDIIILMTVHQKLTEKRGELAKVLNTVVLR